MTISIVIPLYNKEKSITRAIESVMNQTYSDFELIVVDDGSTDCSYSAAAQIQDSRIKVVRQSNQGETAARNRGVAESSYGLVAFLDADDEWKPEFLSEVLSLTNEFDNCGLFGSYYEMRDCGNTFFSRNKIFFNEGWRGIIENYFEVMSFYFPFNSSSVIIKKKNLIDIGGFPPGVKRGGDISTWFKLATTTKFAYVNSPLSIYHLDAENRAMVNYDRPKDDYYPVLTLTELILNRFIIGANKVFALDFIAKQQLPIVREYLRQGEKTKARRMLNTFKGTQRYSKAWMKMFIYSFLPLNLPALAVKLRP